MADLIVEALMGGLLMLWDYISAHIVFCLIPAFFIAGAIAALLPKEKIMKYLGSKVPKYKAYPIAIVAGLLLAVCSCTILPLFAGIRKKGAGIGPAIAFLYTAPATNILAITFTGSVLGWDLAVARIVLSITFAIIIGVTISSLFKEDEEGTKESVQARAEEEEKRGDDNNGNYRRNRLLIFFATLYSVKIIGASQLWIEIKLVCLTGLIIFLLVQLWMSFNNDEIRSWLTETGAFFKMIFPLLLVGVFIAGLLTALIPKDSLVNYVGSNTVPANLAAVLFGVFMYFPTLVEVPMAKMFLGLGMAKGPLLAYLLADPVISLPSILVVRKIMGTRRILVYILLIIIFCTISGLIYGTVAG